MVFFRHPEISFFFTCPGTSQLETITRTTRTIEFATPGAGYADNATRLMHMLLLLVVITE